VAGEGFEERIRSTSARKPVKLRPVALATLLPCLTNNSRTVPTHTVAANVMEDLFLPELSRRRVELRKQSQISSLVRARLKLDNRHRLVEDILAAIDDKIIVRRNEGKGNRKWRPVRLYHRPVPLKPLTSSLSVVRVASSHPGP